MKRPPTFSIFQPTEVKNEVPTCPWTVSGRYDWPADQDVLRTPIIRASVEVEQENENP